MSIESANLFLEDAAREIALRDNFKDVTNAEEFLEVARKLGYDFTTEELKESVSELSKGVLVRRKTGVWPWLRSVKWI
jgi:predicted ribosomally synthesized peptide with nif11-like leader